MFFTWEAVTQYLTGPVIGAAFDFVATAACGSPLAFTYVRKDFDFLEGQVMDGGEALCERYVVRDKLRLFGLAPKEVDNFLEAYGWGVVEHLG